MKLYSSFLVRCWVIKEEAAQRFVFDLEQIQTGEHWRALKPEDAFAQLMQACQQPVSSSNDDAVEMKETS